MNEFIEISREDFESQQAFWPAQANFAYKTISILTSATSPEAEYEKGLTELRHLPRFVGEKSPGDAATTAAAAADGSAVLRLVAIKSEVDTQSNWLPKLWITKEAFLGLIDSTGMHHGVLWLLRHQYDGFHAFRSPTPPGSRTYYIGTSRFALMWAFRPSIATTETHALLIVRREIGGDPVDGLADMLRRHRGCLESPLLLTYMCGLSLGRDFDVELESEQLSNLRSMEKYTGYGPDQTKVRGRNDIDYLTTSLQWIGEILNHVANKERHIRMLDTILGVIEDGMSDYDDIPPDSRDRILKATGKLITAIPPMKCRIDATQQYLGYLKERSERLSTVLLAMLTHEDATINLELADSSRRIAEASQRDSSAMKTIAIMTMAFLPATFLAAVFAIPSLDWDNGGGDVVRGNHWVYWAIALPFTSLVFMVWLLLDNRTAILNIFRITRTNTKIPA